MNEISVKNVDGSIENIDLVNAFKIDNRYFAILSKGEKHSEDTSIVYVSELVEVNPGVYNLVGIKDEQSWSNVHLAMKAITSGTSTDMELYGEKDNIARGNVVKTIEFDNNKKTIGIGSNFLEPLRNQTCFKKEEKAETLSALDAFAQKNSESEIEKIDLPDLGTATEPALATAPTGTAIPAVEQSTETQTTTLTPDTNSSSKFIGELNNLEVIKESPVSVGDFSGMSSIGSLNPLEEISGKVEELKPLDNPSVDPNMTMPVMPDTVAGAPTGVDDKLFEDVIPKIQLPSLEEPKDVSTLNDQTKDEKDLTVNEVQSSTLNLAGNPVVPEIIDVNKILEDRKLALINKISELTGEVTKAFDELKSILSSQKTDTKSNAVEMPKTEESSLVSEALAAISSIQVPTEETSTLSRAA